MTGKSRGDDNVRVVVRCRPLNSKEKEQGFKAIAKIDEVRGQVQVTNPDAPRGEPPKTFTFDTVFAPGCKQTDVYNQTARPIVEAVMEGYNGTIFAYGQTGTGKTYTMEGVRAQPELRGIIPNSFAHIFGTIAKAGDQVRFLVRVSYLEIYNEEVKDLLGKNQKSRLEVKERPDVGVYVKDLSAFVVNNADDMDRIMTLGNKNRSVGSTFMNEHSSRSHAIFSITVERSDEGADKEQHVRVGKLHMVDLAGSERQTKTGATGQRLIEATKINLSLSTLGNVISSLVDGKSTHIPYRNSKLTRLLQDSLGGNAKTVMCANMGPAEYNYDETISTLRYANRAKNIKNKAKINEDPKDALLRQFQNEIDELKKQLADGGEISGSDEDSGSEESEEEEVIGEDGQITIVRRKKKGHKGVSTEKMEEMQRKIDEERKALEEKKDMESEEKNKVQVELERRESELHRAKDTTRYYTMELQKLLTEIDNKQIEMVRFEMTDFYGISHCKGIPSRHFKEKVNHGLPFFGGQMALDPQAGLVSGTGYSEEIAYRDMVYHADLSTFRTLPWEKETARILTFPKYLGNLVGGYPRNVAERLLGVLKSEGYSLYSSHEHEFFVVDAVTKKPITDGVQVRATIRLAKNRDFLSQIAKQLPLMGIDLESFETEYAPGQYEISYKPAFGLQAADNAFTFKNGIKEIAQQHGYLASFTTKPYADQIGASAHLNHSLWDEHGKRNLMFDASSPNGLSKIARHWIAGLLYHAPAITVLHSPTVNCITRIREHRFAPANATWAIDNRSTALRIKSNGTAGGTYVENRMGSSGGCPYTSVAATVAAGLDGIKNEYELPPPVNGLAYEEDNLPPKTAKLPTDMESALEALLADKVICNAMGDEFIKCFVALKKYELVCEAAAMEKGMDHAEWARSYYFDYL